MVMTNIAIENYHLYLSDLFNIGIFHSYVSLPNGNDLFHSNSHINT